MHRSDAVLGAPLTKLALAFGPAEYFSLMVLGLIFAVVLAKGSVLKAIAMIVFGLANGRFFRPENISIVLQQSAVVGSLAVGQTLIILTAGIDLSIGAVMVLSTLVMAKLVSDNGMPGILALLVGIVIAVIAGTLNGVLVTRLRLPPFIVTLGMLEVARGATYLITRSQTQYVGARVETLAEGAVLGLAPPFLAAVGLVALGQFVLTRTVFGRYAAAIGTNEEAVRLAGIDPRPVKVAVFMLAGALAGLAGIVNTARLGAADPNAGIGFELQAIAAVVVGGTSLMGGRGSVVGSFLGVLVIAVLASGLAQAGAQEPTKRLVTGAVIVAAAVADAVRRRR